MHGENPDHLGSCLRPIASESPHGTGGQHGPPLYPAVLAACRSHSNTTYNATYSRLQLPSAPQSTYTKAARPVPLLLVLHRYGTVPCHTHYSFRVKLGPASGLLEWSLDLIRVDRALAVIRAKGGAVLVLLGKDLGLNRFPSWKPTADDSCESRARLPACFTVFRTVRRSPSRYDVKPPLPQTLRLTDKPSNTRPNPEYKTFRPNVPICPSQSIRPGWPLPHHPSYQHEHSVQVSELAPVMNLGLTNMTTTTTTTTTSSNHKEDPPQVRVDPHVLAWLTHLQLALCPAGRQIASAASMEYLLLDTGPPHSVAPLHYYAGRLADETVRFLSEANDSRYNYLAHLHVESCQWPMARRYYLSLLRLALFTEDLAFPESDLHQTDDHFPPSLRTYKIMAYVPPRSQDILSNRASGQMTKYTSSRQVASQGKGETDLINAAEADGASRVPYMQNTPI
ncbi:hypothetical protein CHU98_g10533 [Xylaria longipes]|nr:hypothetical protein CHU98_g10533 [Xylaria longipes]